MGLGLCRQTAVCSLLTIGLLGALPSESDASPVVVWQKDITYPSPAGITTIRLTPDGTALLVFHFTNSSVARVEALDVTDGHELWSRAVSIPTNALTPTGWIDAAGNTYLASRQRTIWKYNSDLTVRQWSFTRLKFGFEFVENVTTDAALNVYASGYNGVLNGTGSTAVKVSPAGTLVWSTDYTATTLKDNYGYALAVDAAGNLYRAGADRQDDNQMRGRLLGHRSTDGLIVLNYSLEMPNSAIFGLGVDASGQLVLGVTYGLRNANGSLGTGTEQSLIRILTPAGLPAVADVLFPTPGRVLVADTLTMSSDGLGFCVGYAGTQAGQPTTGVARFSQGVLDWTSDTGGPDWQLAKGGVEVRADDVYVGMNFMANAGVSRVVKLSAAPPPPDQDGDGVTDGVDNCPQVTNPDQTDSDTDGAGDACDACPLDSNNDADADGVCGDRDNCTTVPNPDQTDTDKDGVGDACDACPLDPKNDADADGVCGDRDNCPDTANADQTNSDADTLGDACDTCPLDPNNDADGDGVCGDRDNCPAVANSDQADTDGDGLGDACDVCPLDPNNDIDGDGLCGDRDACPHSDRSALLVINECNTGVTNSALAGGCTMADEIAQAAAAAQNHGCFTSAVARLVDAWKRAGLISNADKARIVSCAAKPPPNPPSCRHKPDGKEHSCDANDDHLSHNQHNPPHDHSRKEPPRQVPPPRGHSMLFARGGQRPRQ